VSDPVLRSFLLGAREDARFVNRESDVMRLLAEPRSGDPPSRYHGLLARVEHLRRAGGAVVVSREPIAFEIEFPDGYLRSANPQLQFEVVQLHAPVFHPNVGGGIVCLGPRFQPGTRLRALVEQLYAILSARAYAADHAFCPDARDHYRRHADQIAQLRASPLWRRPAAARVRVAGIGLAAEGGG
jgi:hypothetical protein